MKRLRIIIERDFCPFIDSPLVTVVAHKFEEMLKEENLLFPSEHPKIRAEFFDDPE